MDGVAREGDAGGAAVAHVAEDHRLDVDGGAEIVGDLVEVAVVDGALVVPRGEDGLYGETQLLVGIFGEGLPEASRAICLKSSTIRLSASAGISASVAAPVSCFVLFDLLLEGVGLGVEDDLGEHLHEAAVRVVGRSARHR